MEPPFPRPKSANPSYDKIIHAWGDGTGHEHHSGSFHSLHSLSRQEKKAETATATATETLLRETQGLGPKKSSIILWAESSQGLNTSLVDRPHTSNPSRDAAIEAAQHVHPSPCSEAYQPGDYGRDVHKEGSSEVLWADMGAPGVPVHRPTTANPKREAAEAEAEAQHSESPTSSPGRAACGAHSAAPGGVPGAAVGGDGGGAAAHAKHHHHPGHNTSEVLWASEGGVDPALLARPHAWNRQMEDGGGEDAAAALPPPSPRDEQQAAATSPDCVASEVLWSAGNNQDGSSQPSPEEEEEEEDEERGGGDLDVESCSEASRAKGGWGGGAAAARPKSAPYGKMGTAGEAFPMPRTAAAVASSEGGFSPMDAEFWNMFEPLDPDLVTNSVSKQRFYKFYNSLEHFGAPSNAVELCSRYRSAGDDRLTFDEFCIIMLHRTSE